jgi:hypothetical protein
MKKSMIIAILILLSVSFVLAAGSSTGGTQNTTPTPSSPPTQVSRAEACETIDTPKERILCRFKISESERESYNQRYSVVEEACRGSDKEAQCTQLYRRLAPCYKENDAIKSKKCMLKESGINPNQGGTFRAAPKEAKRNYVVAQLYNLQERIEDLHEEGKITDEDATEIVSRIIEIKRMILNGSPRSEIVSKMQEFKQKFGEVMSGVTNE